MGLDPFALKAGLMKPRRGFTPVIGKKLGVGQIKEIGLFGAEPAVYLVC